MKNFSFKENIAIAEAFHLAYDIITKLALQDIRNLVGAKINLFGPRSWGFINQLVNEINNNIFTLSAGKKFNGQSLNFQTVIRNPSAITGFYGSIKNLFDLSLHIWRIITADKNSPYTIDETKSLISDLIEKIQTYEFVEPSAQSIKTKLIVILNNWKNILT